MLARILLIRVPLAISVSPDAVQREKSIASLVLGHYTMRSIRRQSHGLFALPSFFDIGLERKKIELRLLCRRLYSQLLNNCFSVRNERCSDAAETPPLLNSWIVRPPRPVVLG